MKFKFSSDLNASMKFLNFYPMRLNCLHRKNCAFLSLALFVMLYWKNPYIEFEQHISVEYLQLSWQQSRMSLNKKREIFVNIFGVAGVNIKVISVSNVSL